MTKFGNPAPHPDAANRHDYTPPKARMKWFGARLLGSGWWRPWYGLHYLLLVPLWGFYAYCRDFRPGG
jgi:hypothetical protein